jgi:acetyl-CoA C-acetyltransferase
MRDVAIVGCGMTRFGRREEDLLDLLTEASLAALDDARLGKGPVDAVYVANMGAGILNHQTGVASALVDRLGLLPAPADTVENGPASGASAIKNAFLAIASGLYDVILVTGGEKMRAVTGWEATDFVASMTHPQGEYIYGVTLPALAGMFARLHMAKYGVKPEHLAMVALKNHENGTRNPYAHIQQAVTMEGILHRPEAVVNNPPIAEPLRMYDCCPVSDGAASVVLCAAERAKDFPHPIVRIAGMGQATDTHAVHQREDPLELKAVRGAAQAAFEMAELSPKDIQVAELHDAFTILEIVESEQVGFFRVGQGHRALENGVTRLDGKLPINPSGGLKARGHPVGATGVAQVVELVWQLRGQAEGRQVPAAANGFCCNFGGFGNNVLAFVLTRE